jgi:hypothetical protein
MDATLGVLRAAGFSVVQTDHAFHVLDGYILGVSVQQVSIPVAIEDMPRMAAAFLEGVPADEYPWLVEHIRFHIESSIYDEGDFEFGLDLILDGLERLLDDELADVPASDAEGDEMPASHRRRRSMPSGPD